MVDIIGSFYGGEVGGWGRDCIAGGENTVSSLFFLLRPTFSSMHKIRQPLISSKTQLGDLTHMDLFGSLIDTPKGVA